MLGSNLDLCLEYQVHISTDCAASRGQSEQIFPAVPLIRKRRPEHCPAAFSRLRLGLTFWRSHPAQGMLLRPGNQFHDPRLVLVVGIAL
jgi:hypothetical protein